jgi:hypothetical protein
MIWQFGAAPCRAAVGASCRAILVLLAIFSLSGCAATVREGTSLAAMAQRAPKAGHARIAVYRPKGYGGLFDVGLKFSLDDVPMAEVKTGTFVYRYVPPGRHRLVYLSDQFPRPSRHEFDAVAGRTYAFHIQLNDKGKMLQATGAAAGLAGALLVGAVSAATEDLGSYDFIPVDPTALPDIALGAES